MKICRLNPMALKARPNEDQLSVSDNGREILNLSIQYSLAFIVAIVLTDDLTKADSMGTLWQETGGNPNENEVSGAC